MTDEIASPGPVLSVHDLDAVVFDLDGVVTNTASLHLRAWKETFDAYLEERSQEEDGDFVPFTEEDYRRYVDGKPRYDGTESFLESRGLSLPFGDPNDPAREQTICGLANRKNRRFRELLEVEGPGRYESSVALVEELRDRGVATAVISSSKNCRRVLEAAGIEDLFDVRVDGEEMEELALPGKPDPAIFEEAAVRLDISRDRIAVVEDAIAGVEAARRGGFALVIGVDRTGHADELREAGADLVVRDLGELQPTSQLSSGSWGRSIRDLPPVLDREDELRRRIGGRELAVFLDYDGTLTPIVDDPDRAVLPEATRETVLRLSRRHPVAVLSGRDLPDVREKVGLDGIFYAGSHGFDVRGPGGVRWQRGEEFLPSLDRAQEELEERLSEIPGARVERKRFAIAVHYRQAAPEAAADVDRVVTQVAEAHGDLRKTGGKKIFELRPDLDWDKGQALLELLEVLGLDREDVLPIYVGDDVTDDDAFRVLEDRGLALVVRGEDDDRPSAADYSLEDPEAVRRFLELLLAVGADQDRESTR